MNNYIFDTPILLLFALSKIARLSDLEMKYIELFKSVPSSKIITPSFMLVEIAKELEKIDNRIFQVYLKEQLLKHQIVSTTERDIRRASNLAKRKGLPFRAALLNVIAERKKSQLIEIF